MAKKPETLMQSVDGEVMRSTPMTDVRVCLVLLHKTNERSKLVMAEVEFGDAEGEQNMQEFINNAAHALEPGEQLQRRTLTFSLEEIDEKLRDTRDLD